ncbi:MAG: GGDEF domain-containing protein [Burkholderiaceae bacterium]
MTGLFNLRTRLALGIALLLIAALGSVYYLASRLSDDLADSGNRNDMNTIETRLLSAWERERELMVGKLFEAAYDPANSAQLRSGGGDALLLRLTLTLGVNQAWLTSTSNEILSQAGPANQLPTSADSIQIMQRAFSIGRAEGVVSNGGQAAIVAAVRMQDVKPNQVLVVAQPINQLLARQLTEYTGAQLSFVKFATGGVVRELGGLVSPALTDDLKSNIEALASAGVQTSKDFTVGDRRARLRMLHQSRDGNVYVAIVPSSSPVAYKVEDFTYYVGIIAAIGLAIALACGLLFGSRLTRSISDLTHATRQLSNGQYDEFVQVRSRDELGRFTESFNLLAQSLKQREAKLLQGAYRDTVTGLPSRPLFENHLVETVAKARAKSGTMALLIVSVDRLREVNDSLGRKASDSMLSEIADRIRRALRTQQQGGQVDIGTADSFVARLSTYEFGIIVPECDEPQANGVANKIAEVVSRRVQYEGQSVLPGGKVGVAVFPEHAVDPGGLIYSADIAASRAGSELSRIAVFDPSFERDRQNQVAMLNELSQALERDELHIAMQPKISLNASKQGVLMAEALMRWEHPERGPQNPGEFVPFAEKTGFITQLTNWMIDGALETAAAYMAQGVPLAVCVNLSPRDLGSPEFTTFVVERLRAHKLRGSSLTLEITEAAVMNASPVVRQNLDVLWRLGVKIAIDDFGSGYASLDQLRALPLSYIKIDRQYIRGLVSDDASRILVKSAIDLGHAIGVEVVAEGVETLEQLDALKELGCDQAQGYFVGKPLPAVEFEAWVRNESAEFGIDASQMASGAVLARRNEAIPAAAVASAEEEVALASPVAEESAADDDDDDLSFETVAVTPAAEPNNA